MLLDRAREVLADGLGVRPDELSLHPSGAHALGTAMTGLRHARRRVGSAVVTSATDQASVLVQTRDHPPVPVDRLGRVDLEQATAAVGADGVALAVLHHGNGEVGTLQPVDEVHEACLLHEVPLLVDATASLGRLAPPTGFDALVGEASSFGGPPAVGLLAVRTGTRFSLPGPRLEPEHGRATADPWVPLALAAAEALQQVRAVLAEESASARSLVEQVRRTAAGIPGVDLVGDPVDRLPHVLTCSVLYVDGESIVHELDRRGIAVASGSACTSSTLEPSHVLAAMGALTHGNIRVTLPLEAVSPTRAGDVARLVAELPGVLTGLRDRLGVSDL